MFMTGRLNRRIPPGVTVFGWVLGTCSSACAEETVEFEAFFAARLALPSISVSGGVSTAPSSRRV